MALDLEVHWNIAHMADHPTDATLLGNRPVPDVGSFFSRPFFLINDHDNAGAA